MAKTTIGMDGQIPWEASMVLGAGYDIDKFQTVQSALTDLHTTQSAQKHARDVLYESHVICSDEELRSQIDVSGHISGCVTPLFSLEASSEYLRSIKYNTKTMTTIIRCTIISCSTETISSCKLTKDAEKCLKRPVFGERTPKVFFDHYGQYYIWGKESQSTLFAICTHTADTKEKLDSFRSAMGFSYNLTNLKAIVGFVRKATSCKVDTKIKVNMTGSGTATLGQSLSATAFQKVLEDFVQNHVPVPRAAILKHYCFLDRRVPRPQERDIVPLPITEAYRLCLGLEIRSRSCRMAKVKEVESKLAYKRKELSAVRPSMTSWKEDVSTLCQKLLALELEVDKLFQMQSLLQQARSASTSIERKSWRRASQTVAWTAGTTNYTSTPLSPEIRHQTYKLAQGCHRISQNSQIITGFRIESNRLDGNNGSWRLNGGWIGHDCVEVEFKSDLFHKSSWTVEVWSVDKGMYAECV